MTGRDGFRVMDVDPGITNDPKWRRIARLRPDHAAPAFAAYVALMGESWANQERRPLTEDIWPVFLPWDPEVVATMVEVGLLDVDGRINEKAWTGWFLPALERLDAKRLGGTISGLRSHGMSLEEATAEAKRRWAESHPSGGSPQISGAGLEPTSNPPPTGLDPSTPSTPGIPPVPPPSGGHGSRANGTNPRAIAKAAQAAADREAKKRSRAIEAIKQRYYAGEITEAEQHRLIRAFEAPSSPDAPGGNRRRNRRRRATSWPVCHSGTAYPGT